MADLPAGLAPLSVDMTVGGTRLQLQAQLPRAPVRPVRLLPLLRQVDDVLIADGVRRVEASGERISCQAGCATCCYYLVPIAPVDARRLADLVASAPQDVQAVMRARFAAARERLAEAGLLQRLLERASLPPEEQAVLGDAYFPLGIPCPFLEDNRCAIYRERPLACREFNVTSPKEQCAAPGAQVRLLRLPGRPSVAAAALEPGLPFFDGGWVPLVLALEWVAQHPEPEPPLAKELAERFFTALGADQP